VTLWTSSVDDGWITLKGDLEFQSQRDPAFDDVAGLYAVTGVTNATKVVELL
jgi:osmotically-inducible protein OsmY